MAPPSGSDLSDPYPSRHVFYCHHDLSSSRPLCLSYALPTVHFRAPAALQRALPVFLRATPPRRIVRRRAGRLSNFAHVAYRLDMVNASALLGVPAVEEGLAAWNPPCSTRLRRGTASSTR